VELRENAEVLAAIRRHRGMLEPLEVLPPDAFAALPCQLLHGDFHDQQVLFAGDRVSALVDWEIWHADPKIWELIRSLAFSELLETPLLEPYLEGYGRHVRLSEEECRLGWQLWWQTRVVGLWVWGAYYLEGHSRVRQHFPAVTAELELVADVGRRERCEERFMAGVLGR
jgi:Ser/Thr protein kinase RdoA (MazF antagonist)